MRLPTLCLLVTLVAPNAAFGADCAGSGSDRVLTIGDWSISRGIVPAVDLRYQIAADEKPILKLSGHLYFQTPLEVLAEAALDIESQTALEVDGMTQIILDGADLNALVKAEKADVSVLVCTNYIEYVDGSGVIID